jgi:glyceraldehyde 3-phosphate dehydrogenase
MTIKVGINGFGRIGRMAFRAISKEFPEIEVVAINDLLDPDYLAYMLKYDSVHGRFEGEIAVEGSNLVVNGKKIRLTAERDPANLKWNEAGADMVIESTGFFLSEDVPASTSRPAPRRWSCPPPPRTPPPCSSTA